MYEVTRFAHIFIFSQGLEWHIEELYAFNSRNGRGNTIQQRWIKGIT
jgi:hypothetical protein